MRLPLPREISLANKCLLLFGGAVVLIVVAALTAPWLRMNALVEERQVEIARRLTEIWQRLDAQAREAGARPEPDESGLTEYAGIRARWVPIEEARRLGEENWFVRSALRQFEDDPARADVMESSWDGATRIYRYARAARAADDPTQQLAGLVLMERRSDDTAVLLVVNTVYLLSAGLMVLALALLVFYLVTHKLVLSPVRALRRTAEHVREGDLSSRSDIRTGDEYQELAETFNSMLEQLQQSQEHQSATNKALDLKLNELAEANSALFEANKLKADFLASVSHELRTPLNSIIGFAELLLEIADRDARARAENGEPGESLDAAKRRRYLVNILEAGRGLLEMIESLLEMAKIEAGRVEVSFEPMSVPEACETLATLIHPLAQQKGVEVRLDVPRDLPLIRTDAKRFQQIVFNFLANAVKFVDQSEGGGPSQRITIRGECLPPLDEDSPQRVRVSVIDTGPGIPAEQQDRIFEKFHQIDAGHTREHQGAGLGLAICRELSELLQGELQLVSEVGRGSMFSLILPVEPDLARAREQSLETSFRGSLTRGAPWKTT